MYIYEIVQPGTWLDNENQHEKFEAESIVRSLISQFYEANLCLNLFLSSVQSRSSGRSSQWNQDSIRKADIRREIESKLGRLDAEHWEDVNFEAELIFKREQWSKGRLPREFEHNTSFIYARSFLYALDSFDKFTKVLKNNPISPESISDFYDEISVTFPDLRGVRNTSQHMEDRSRGLGAGRNPKPLDLKPINNNMVNSDNGALMLNCLNGTKYGNTMADGHYGEVDVSPRSMEMLQSILQRILDALSWTGAKSHYPNI
ncbi:hypothetical protein [Shewanella kaireitica]|uniref:hypothetical protein n=1 Tax=Shewanella kaireitica TaxID=212021 RepID=UPI00200FD20B|nr:hypothetical protein [Shewanella kaireitica]MCL1095663.1 hypothetical protein [Shewanella kaireitica]